MTTFRAVDVLGGLKQFQRDTVEHVFDRFYGPDPTRRFLVADETGLGKSLVARGVVARTVEHLMEDPSVDRIDVVYVCSSADLAAQNLKRIDVVHRDAGRLQFADRLSMLALDAHRLQRPVEGLAKPVNLISFTPGTSFDQGRRSGKAEERALAALLLREQLGLGAWDMRATYQILRGNVSDAESFKRVVDRIEARLDDHRDPDIVRRFQELVRMRGLDHAFRGLVCDVGRKRDLPADLRERTRDVTSRLRDALAKAGVDTLQPDLIILDEFQRFRQLLAAGEKASAAAELAHQLFDHGQARVLLLSATPYKPYTLAEESSGDDDHYRDFVESLRFLCNGDEEKVAALASDLAAYRAALLTGGDMNEPSDRLRAGLLRVMCRTERPRLGDDGMLVERSLPASDVRPEDLVDYVALHRVAKIVDAPLTVEYWKSAPYFANFMDGYQLGQKVAAALKHERDTTALEAALRRTRRLDATAVDGFRPVDPANAKMRRLLSDTVASGWWQLLWMPPSLPYLRPGGPWADPMLRGMTKRLLFSSWSATPTAVASLLSYEAERRIAEGTRHQDNTRQGRDRLATRLTFRLVDGRPGAMTTLALFWPQPALAERGDPLTLARLLGGGRPVPTDEARAYVAGTLGGEVVDGDSTVSAAEAWSWTSALRLGGAVPVGLAPAEIVGLLGGGEETDGDDLGLSAHVEQAFRTLDGEVPEIDRPAGLRMSVAEIGVHAPGNVAWRAVRRLCGPGDDVTDAGVWRAAAVIASGLRTLFNRYQSSLVLDRLYGQGRPYWQVVLSACADGNLQAVLDEHLFHLRTPGPSLDDAALAELAREVRTALTLAPATYQASSPLDDDAGVSFPCRFAIRYGAKQGDTSEQGVSRLSDVQKAFNSPFWPFVLATTSVGQEGIDFHRWCHAVFHWNTPASPVDFEQREGRVHRYAGHAVRRNVAHDHGDAVLAAADEGHPWDLAWRLASERVSRFGELAPHWIYPGPFKIERHVAPLPLSRDLPKLQSLKEDLALYRLAFGQPRQEDLVSLLARRQGASGELGHAVIDLRPPDAARPDLSSRHEFTVSRRGDDGACVRSSVPIGHGE